MELSSKQNVVYYVNLNVVFCKHVIWKLKCYMFYILDSLKWLSLKQRTATLRNLKCKTYQELFHNILFTV